MPDTYLDERGLGAVARVLDPAAFNPPKYWPIGAAKASRERAMHQARTAIRAYVAAVGEPVAVNIRPLEWSEPAKPDKSCSYDYCRAETPFGMYEITWKGWKDFPGYTVEFLGEIIPSRGDNLDAAKSAAQADYEARVRSALAAPQPSQSRDEVEEAIARAFRRGWSWRGENPGMDEYVQKAASDHADWSVGTLALSASPQREGAGTDMAGAAATRYCRWPSCTCDMTQGKLCDHPMPPSPETDMQEVHNAPDGRRDIEPGTIRVCPERDARCPHGMHCPYNDGYRCDIEGSRAALAARPAPTVAENAKVAPAPDEWFELGGDARLGECVTEGCGGQPTWRLEAGGVGSNYCSGCRARILAARPSPPKKEG